MKPASLPLALLSLLLSILLWFMLYQPPEESTIQVSLNLEYQGKPPQNLVVTRVPKTLTVFATATKQRLNEIETLSDQKDSGLTGVVFLDDVKPGTNRLPVTIFPAKYKDSFPDLNFASVEAERELSRKMSVEVVPIGQMPDPTLSLDDTVADPPNVTISGAASIVSDIARVTADLDLSQVSLTQRGPQYSSVQPIRSNGAVETELSIDKKVIKITPVVSASPQSKRVSVFAQITGTAAPGYIMSGFEVKPSLLTIRGSSRAVATITQISTEPVSIDGLTKSTELTVGLRVPQGLAVEGVKQVTIRVMINHVDGATGAGGP